jgi:hypothetical protein
MKQCFAYALFTALTLSIMVGKVPAAQAAMQPSAAQSASGTGKSHGTFTVELTKALDSKKVKVGDAVEAKLTGGITLPNGTPVARGTNLVGHVTVATARSSGGSDSTLGIVFDKIARSGGEDTPINGVVQAAAPNPNADVGTGGSGVDYGNTMKAAGANPPNPDASRPPVKLLNEQSVGVLGIKNLQLGPDGVFTSSGKEVKLDSGTRILLNVTM